MDDKSKNNSINKEIWVILGALTCCTLWGSAFPSIKVGYKLWNIASSDSFAIVVFAGSRFFIAGILVILFASLMGRKFLVPKKEELPKIMFLSLFQTIGQYFFFYMGLAHTTGVNSSVINATTTFFSILIAALIFRMERLTFRKILGCILGFIGILIINITKEGFTVNLLGDGMIVMSSVCYGISSCLIKKYSTGHDTVTFSGYQFMFGGFVMILLGGTGMAVSGSSGNVARAITISAPAVLILIYLAFISSVAYTLWGILLRKNDVSRISIFGFTNPIIGVLLCAVFLGEKDQMGWRYLIALMLVSAGIIVVNRKGRKDRLKKQENA